MKSKQQCADLIAEVESAYLQWYLRKNELNLKHLRMVRKAALAAMQPDETSGERAPVPVSEIIRALEREAANTDSDPRWLAATCLRQIMGWETRTLICDIDTRPSVTIGAVKAPENAPDLAKLVASVDREIERRAAEKTPEHHRDMSGDYPQRTRDCLACNVGNPGVYVKDGVMYCPHRPESSAPR
jgi:hypothetical protein